MMIGCIWDEFSIPMKKFIKKRIADEEDAEDVLQEVFLKIHNNIRSLENEKKIHAWIYTIARNAITDYYRKNSRMIKVTQLDENIEDKGTEKLSANMEIAACLKAMINTLPEKYKQAIMLSEFQNMTQKEMSEKLGISVSGGKSRVQRGRKMLREMLLGCCQMEFDTFGNIIDYEHKDNECKYCKKRDV